MKSSQSGPRADLIVVRLGLPSQRARLGVERYDEAFRRGEVEHVVIEGKGADSSAIAYEASQVAGQLAFVLP